VNNLLIGIICGACFGFAVGVLWLMVILDDAEKELIRGTYKTVEQKRHESSS